MVQEQFNILSPTSKSLLRFLINARWWQQWCDYVNFDTSLFHLKNIKSRENSVIRDKVKVSNLNKSFSSFY